MALRNVSNRSFEQNADDSWNVGETRYDEIWGADETEYWAEVKAEKEAADKQGRPQKVRGRPVQVDELPVHEVDWKMPSIQDVDLASQLAERQSVPLPITRTAISPLTDMTKAENKRRIFRNLHRQLGEEVERADWSAIEAGVKKEADGYCRKPVEAWEDMDMDVMEPRIRELVRFLIKTRRDRILRRPIMSKPKEEPATEEEELLIDLS